MELARVACLTREVVRGKRHNGLQDDSGALKESLGMALPQGDITQSSIHGAQQTEIDSRTSHNQSMRKSVGSSTRGSRSTTLRCRMPWPQGCSLINRPPPANDQRRSQCTYDAPPGDARRNNGG
jgi:hypothetical protein